MTKPFYIDEIMPILKALNGAGSLTEEKADSILCNTVKDSMNAKLHEAREKGRHGWWDESVCSIKDLYIMRDQAICDGDHISVINYSAMIAVREGEKSI